MKNNRDQAVLPDWTMVAFTGHRSLDNPDKARAGISRAYEAILRRRSPLVAIASVAAGGDTLFLQEARRRGIPYYALLPFERSRFQSTMSEAEWGAASPLLDAAMSIEELPATDNAEDSFLETGVRSVDMCDFLVALWDGEPARGTGGTAEIVAYARAVQKPILLVDPVSGTLTEERLDSLPEQLQNTPDPGTTRPLVETLLGVLDSRAVARRPSFLVIIVLHLLAEIFAVVPLVWEWHDGRKSAFSALELSCLIFALIVALNMRHVHASFLQSRLGAELCRSFLAIWNLHRGSDTLPHIASPAFSRLRQNLTVAWLLDDRPGRDFSSARDDYLRSRIENQMEYFARQHALVAPRFRFFKRVANSFTIGAIVLGAVAFAAGLLAGPTRPPHWLEFLTLGFPLVSAAIVSVLLAKDYQRRTYRYREMLDMLKGAAERLRITRTWGGLTRIAVETEEALLQEVVEWHSISAFTQGH